MMSTRGLDGRNTIVLVATWIVLVSITIASTWLPDSIGIASSVATKLTLGAALLKGHLIAGVFMEMHRGPIVWAVVMSAFLIAQSILLVAILP